jgi:hypothetical protein
MKKQETFKTSQALSLENSFGTIKQDTVELEVTVGINSEDYGWFELYDVETGGDEWYAEGGLQIEDKTVTGYDGVFSLPTTVTNKLKEWGYNVSEVE